MDKVIEFPKHKVVREVPDTIKEERNQRAQQKMADTIVDEITGLDRKSTRLNSSH